MPRMRLLRAGLLLAAAASTGLAQTQTDWRFAQPDADLRLSVNLKAVLASPLIAAAIQQIQAQVSTAATRAGQSRPGQPAFDRAKFDQALRMLSSIDRIAVSARQRAAATAAGASTNPDALILLTGNESFDPAALQATFPNRGSSQVRAVGTHTVLIGDGASFTAALRRMSGAAASPRGLDDELAGSDIWISGDANLMNQTAARRTVGAAPPVLQSLRAFSLGLNLGASPELSLVLRATNADAAGKMMAMLDQLQAQLKTSPQAAIVQNALDIRREGTRLRIHFVVPAEVMQMAQAQLTSGALSAQMQPLLRLMGLGSSAGTAATAVDPQTPPPPANGGKIMIYGLDGGPREVKQ